VDQNQRHFQNRRTRQVHINGADFFSQRKGRRSSGASCSRDALLGPSPVSRGSAFSCAWPAPRRRRQAILGVLRKHLFTRSRCSNPQGLCGAVVCGSAAHRLLYGIPQTLASHHHGMLKPRWCGGEMFGSIEYECPLCPDSYRICAPHRNDASCPQPDSCNAAYGLNGSDKLLAPQGPVAKEGNWFLASVYWLCVSAGRFIIRNISGPPVLRNRHTSRAARSRKTMLSHVV
jgi:hypothetical protein